MVFIYGAYGFTGRQVVELISKKIHGFYIAGRNELKLKRVYEKCENKPEKYFVVSPENISSLIPELKGKVDLVVNTAGPFSDFGEKIVSFAYDIGANYIDCSGEAFWTKRLIDIYSEKFEKKGIFLSSGVAWETVAGECAIKKLLKEADPTGKTVYLIYLAEFNMSPGTLQSSINIIRDGAIRWNNGRAEITKPFEVSFTFDFKGKKFFATNISTSDVLNVPLSLGEMRGKVTFEVLFATKRAYFISFMRLFSKLVKIRGFSPILKTILDRFPEPDERKSPASAIAFLVENSRIVKMDYIDSSKPYRTTARIISTFVEEFVKGNIRGKGYRAPTELYDFKEEIFYEK